MKSAYITIGLIILIAVLVMAFVLPLFFDFDPIEINPRTRLSPPSKDNLLGTDEFGRDIFSRVIFGTRVSLSVGFLVILITTVTGTLLGLYSGVYSRLDLILMRILDGWMAFPEIIIAITLAAIWGSGQLVIILAISFAYFPRMCRIVRGTVLSIKTRGFIEAAQATGASDHRLIFKYILPNCFSNILVQTTFSFAAAILAEAALSFLGVGIQAPNPSLGGMISEGRNFMPIAPWIVLAPGLLIVLIVLALNFLGDGLRDYFDPKMKFLK